MPPHCIGNNAQVPICLKACTHAPEDFILVKNIDVIVIPLVGLVLLKLTNDRKLMGKYRNGWLTNVALTILILVALYMTFNNAVKLWNTLNEWLVG